jgi:hypothetical protein
MPHNGSWRSALHGLQMTEHQYGYPAKQDPFHQVIKGPVFLFQIFTYFTHGINIFESAIDRAGAVSI